MGSTLPPDDMLRLVEAIHAAPQRLVYVFAGAGSQALYWLHAVGGSSRTLLEAVDCYAPRSLAAVVGAPPGQAVSEATARRMAAWAYERASVLAEDTWPLLGVACTAAVRTDRARRGADRAVLAVQSAGVTTVLALPLAPGERLAQEEQVSRAVMAVLARACALEP